MFSKIFSKKSNIRNEKVREETKFKNILIGSPERGIMMNWDVSAQKLWEKFANWRQPSLEIFEEALKVAKETGKTASIIVDYDADAHKREPFQKVSENVWKNPRMNNEFWI